jgi:hypothetical protein
MEVAGNAALFCGPHKLVKRTPPYGDGQWELYNVEEDPGETEDISERSPDLVQAYRAYAAEVGVEELPASYSPVRQIWINSLTKHPIGFVRFTTVMALNASVPLSLLGLLLGVAGTGAAGFGLIRWLRRSPTSR